MSLRAGEAKLLSSVSRPFGRREAQGAGSIGSLDAFAPSNGCGLLLAVSVLISLINSAFLSAATEAADFPGGGPAAAEEAAHGGAVRTEAPGMVSSSPGGDQHHRERNQLLRHLGRFLHSPDWFALSFPKWFLFSSLLSFTSVTGASGTPSPSRQLVAPTGDSISFTPWGRLFLSAAVETAVRFCQKCPSVLTPVGKRKTTL